MSDRYTLSSPTLYELLNASLANNPDAVAQRYKDGSAFVDLSYRQVYENISIVAAGLRGLGMENGDPVGLIADAGHRWLWVSMGIAAQGGVDVPRGTDATRDDLLYIFQHASCKIALLEHAKVYEVIQADLARLPEIKAIVFFDDPGTIEAPSGVQILSLDALMKRGRDALGKDSDLFERMGRAVQPADLATIIYTS